MIGLVLVDRTGVLNARRRTAVAMFARSERKNLLATLDRQQTLAHREEEKARSSGVVLQSFH